MDYQGNYFPEEHDERESKTYRTVKGIFKWTMYGLSFLVYAIIFFVIFSSCDSRIITQNYYGGYIENFDPAGETVYRLNTEEFMNYDGSVQLSDIDYSDKYGFLEVGVKLNAKKQLGGNKDERFEAVLTDNLGNTFTLAGVQRDTNLRYSFARFSFSGVALDLAQHENGESSADYGRYLTLTIYRAGGGEVIDSFTVYHGDGDWYYCSKCLRFATADEAEETGKRCPECHAAYSVTDEATTHYATKYED